MFRRNHAKNVQADLQSAWREYKDFESDYSAVNSLKITILADYKY